MRGAVEGIGFYFSTGDDGDERRVNTGAKQTDMPASLPWVTAVGGTSLAIGKNEQLQVRDRLGHRAGPAVRRRQEPGPASPALHLRRGRRHQRAGSTQPFYQRGVVPAALAPANGGVNRVVPDIAAVADPNTGFLVGQTQTFPDGTAPLRRVPDRRHLARHAGLIAGVQALAQQATASRPLGFANPAIYERYGTSAYHDVTDHPLGPDTAWPMVRVDFDNGVDASDGLVTCCARSATTPRCTPPRGYDDVTGVGSPATGYLASFRAAQARALGLPGRGTRSRQRVRAGPAAVPCAHAIRAPAS